MKDGGPLRAIAPKVAGEPSQTLRTGKAIVNPMVPVVSTDALPGEKIGLKKNYSDKLSRGADITASLVSAKTDAGYKIPESFVGATGAKNRRGHESIREVHRLLGEQATIPGVYETYTENNPSKKTIVATKDGNKIVDPSMGYLERESYKKLKSLRGQSGAKNTAKQIRNIERYEESLRKGMADGGDVSLLEKSGSLISTGTDLVSGALEGLKEDDINMVGRRSPAKLMRKNARLGTAQSMISGTGKGAAAGAALGLPGVIAGGAIGFLSSGIGALINKSKNDEAIEEAVSEWSSGHASNYAKNMSHTGFKDGGKIKGRGTGKSDDIPMDVSDGSFIVPAENSELAMELGRSYLGWNTDEKAMKDGGSVKIKASNGEVLFSPSEVGVLRYYGVDVDSLAPNAKTSTDMKCGGKVKKMATGGFAEEEASNNEFISAHDKTFGVGETSKNINKGPDWYAMNANRPAKKKADWDSFMKSAPEFLGALQMAGGTAGLIAAGKKPDRAISHTLKALSAETRKLSEYGYEPKVVNALNQSIERARIDYNRMVAGRGGSPMEIQKQLEQGLVTTIGEKGKMHYADAAEKARKYTQHLQVQSQVAGQEFDINRFKIEDWYKNQEAYAEMLSAGISNIIGGRQLKAQQDTMKEIAKEGTVNISV